MRVLITGVTGFVGSHLAELALKNGAEVYGACRWRSCRANISQIYEDIRVVTGDLTDPSAVRHILEESKPDVVYHLAAQSFVPCSFEQPRETMTTNVSAQINLLHGLRENLAGRMVIAGSSEEYGLVYESELPIKETNPLRPLSPYAVSKVAQDLISYQYHHSYGVHVVRARAFNHTGPRRGPVFVTSSFAKQIAEIEQGVRPPVIYVGNLDSVRDFTDVRDTVRAYWLLADKGKPGDVYNIATGRGWTIRGVLDYLLQFSTKSRIEIKTDPTRMRPSDVPRLVGDAEKLKAATGWEAEIPFEKTLRDILNYWRERVSSRQEMSVSIAV